MVSIGVCDGMIGCALTVREALAEKSSPARPSGMMAETERNELEAGTGRAASGGKQKKKCE
jgi:hypothetical protein